MSTHSIDKMAGQGSRRLMNGALLRVAATAALSVLFALIDCAVPSDQGQSLALPTVIGTSSALAQAAAATPADSLDQRVGADSQAGRN
jgi:hypothetical protein